MRQLLAISLLILFGLPFALPLLGANAADAELPVCCRRNGKHHCAMMREFSPSKVSVGTVREKCPYSIAPPATIILPAYIPPASASIFAGVTRHPAVAAQVEAQFRISFDRARQKRGPPTISV